MKPIRAELSGFPFLKSSTIFTLPFISRWLNLRCSRIPLKPIIHYYVKLNQYSRR
ncbi:hypothetical protein YC2023_104786 [Brassica napus]